MSFSSKLKAFFGISQPVDQAHTLPRASLEAGSLRGSLKNWVPQQTHLRRQQAFERDLAIARVDDLYCDDLMKIPTTTEPASDIFGCN